MQKTSTIVHGHVTVAHVAILPSPALVPKSRPCVKEVGISDRISNREAFPFYWDSGLIKVTQVSVVAKIVQFRSGARED